MASLEVFMEGKSGILIILVILSALLLVAAIFFGVSFGIKLTAVVADYNVNLYLCIGCAGFFVLSALGAIIARNSVISADNTYDILCRIDAFLKEKGMSEADLARKDLSKGEKIAKKELQLRAKIQAKALKDVAAENKIAQIEATKQEAIEAAIKQDNAEAQTVTEKVVAADVAKASEPEKPAVKEEINTISHEDWKAALEGKVKCGECGGNYSINKTKMGKIVLSCQTARREPDKCSAKAFVPIETFMQEFNSYYKEFYGNVLDKFDLEVMKKTISSVEIKNGKFYFKANSDAVE